MMFFGAFLVRTWILSETATKIFKIFFCMKIVQNMISKFIQCFFRKNCWFWIVKSSELCYVGPRQLYLFFDRIDMSGVKLYVLSQQLPALLIPAPCNIREGMLGQVLEDIL